MTEILQPLSFPLKGTRLIEASAGTGKTFTIALLYVRLVLQHGDANAFTRPLNPQDILVVTFTNAATEELRDRIRRRLTQAARCFRKQDDDKLLTELRDSYPEERWPAQARILDLAASNMDEAAIHTIHGWSQRMLRQHAFDSGNNFGAELEGDDSDLIAEVARDYWRTFITPQSPEALEQVEKVARDPDGLASRVRGLLSDPGPAPTSSGLDTLANWARQLAEQQERSRSLWRTDKAAIHQWFADALEKGWLHGGSFKADKIPEELAQLDAWAENGDALPDKLAKKYAASRVRLKKGGQPPELDALQSLDSLVDHLDTCPDLEADLLPHAAHWCRQRLDGQKRRFNRMSYDDLLTRLSDALAGDNGPALAERIRRQFPVALIDEFQDTDPVQYGMFKRLYVGQEGTGLFMIGDPKQAIYAFRGADIHTYLQARQDTADAHYTLMRNFRSEEKLVSAVNRLFAQGEGRADGPFLFRDEIPFVHVAANGRKDQLLQSGAPVTPLTLWHPDHDQPLNLEDYRQSYAAVTASQIVAQLQAAQHGELGFDKEGAWEPLQAAHIAILVRSHTEARLMQDALAERGVRSVFLSEKSSVFQTPEAMDLLLWLEAVAEPLSESRLRRALGTASLGLGFERLDRAAETDADWEAWTEQFRDYHQLWQQRGVLPLVRRLLDDFDVPAKLLNYTDGERSLTNLLQLGELLQQAETQLDGQQALLRHLEEHIEQGGPASADEQVLRLESDESLVKIVTIHKSKGLEYPLVYLPFVAVAREVSKKDAPLKVYRDGQPQWCYQPDKADLETADRERLAEDLRLLYVALTRASHACWVGLSALGNFTQKGYTCKLKKSAVGYLLAEGQPLAPDDFQAALAQLADPDQGLSVADWPEPSDQIYTPPADDEALRAAREISERLHTPWWVGSYSSLASGAHMDRTPTLAEDSPEEANLREGETPQPVTGPVGQVEHDFPRGAQAGTFLHGILEWAAEQGFANVAEQADIRHEKLQTLCERRGWDDWTEDLDAWLLALLDTPLTPPPIGEQPGDPLRLRDLADHQLQPELEFWFAAHQVDSAALDQRVQAALFPGQRRAGIGRQRLNGMLKGFIDLVFEWQGRYYVVDYKSNALGESDDAYTEGAMTDAILEHRYELQYSLYTLALHRLLQARLPGYRYDRHMGGVMYLFLRGIHGPEQGVHRVRPPKNLIEALDGQFREQHQEVMDGF
ncbi:exodeoxyribonuclease V subunit beta [Marinobacteraceae bacterium S3BR75-40.1]